jgi:3-hydroxyisobutyrate dehydrogenase-like beta-hydroxyacid dehydrogenase
MSFVKIGFIGFGEVGTVFSKAMRDAGAEITVYDILLDQTDTAENMKKKILESGNKIGNFQEVVTNSDYVLSTVITQVTKKVADDCAKYLNKGQIYVDLNSTSPSVKVDLNNIIAPTGADFVEGAILGAVGATGAKTRILTSGAKGQEVAETLNSYGLNVSYYSSEIGKASMFKMLRSIFSKGVEIILLEMMVAGKRAGIEKDLWEDICHFMASKPFDKIGSNWMASHAVAHGRRYYEMLQVVETMQEIEIQPIMTERTAEFFKQSLDMKMNEEFSEKPDSFYEVVEFIENKLRVNKLRVTS